MASENDNNPLETDSNNDQKQQTESRDVSIDSNSIDLNSEYVQFQLAELESLKPSRSGYMLFAKSNRKPAGQCGAVAEQSKRIGALWNALSEKEKEEWNKKVEEEKKRYDEYLETNPEKKRLLTLKQEEKRMNKNKMNISFPLGTIKKIILKDPDIGRISKESLIVINHSTNLFIKQLVNKINNEQTMIRSSKTISENDLLNTLHSNSKYMFIRHVFKKNKNSVLGVKRSNARDININNNEPPKKKSKHNQNINNNNNGNTITQFFNQKK